MKIYQIPRPLVIRPAYLGVSLGAFWALVVLALTLVAMAGGGARGLVAVLQTIYPGYGPTLFGLLAGLFWGFLSAYLFGLLLGIAYIRLLRAFRAKGEKGALLFEIDPNRKVNVIQEGTGKYPYTIVFVANPQIELLANPGTAPLTDPIIRDRNLYARVLIRCLRSFITNELLRLPDIFQQLRIISIFDPDEITGGEMRRLCVGIHGSTDILAPRSNALEICEYIKARFQAEQIPDENIDVVMLISASDVFTRSAARFSVDDPASGGQPFRFTFSEDLDRMSEHIHPFYAAVPGVAAISAWDDRLKTPVHEFAHAMSSLENGAIDDEYIDETHAAMELRVNKRFRGGYLVSQAAIDDLANYIGDPNHLALLQAAFTQLRDHRYAGQEAFSAAARQQINNDPIFFDYRQILLSVFRYRASYRHTDQSRERLLEYGVPAEILRKLEPLYLQPPFFEKTEFLDQVRKAINDETAFQRYKLLILRFANFRNYPVPGVFAKYQLEGGETVTYYSDRQRSDKDSAWVSYAPERSAPGTSCIMDIAYHDYHFDKLLFDFMYDRLMARIGRGEPITKAAAPAAAKGKPAAAAPAAGKRGAKPAKGGKSTASRSTKKKKE